jgi:UDP-N-acetylglucosamine--N-acetylmuramyl-(pentapeptide) pyrophosphoryl-undecaprenol N-acetylglucosamine transferase
MVKTLIAAGGTGGHFYPALTLAKELKKRGDEVIFALRPNEPVIGVLQSEGISFVTIDSAPIAGQSILKTLKGFLLNFIALFSSLRTIQNFKPNCVVGFGAYVSVPIIVAAALKRIPIILHEQNPVPGLANRFCSIFAKTIAVSFPETEKYFPNKSVVTGNLLRQEIFEIQRKYSSISSQLKDGLKTILVFGGSAGAKSINRAVVQSLPKLSDIKNAIQFIHIAGSKTEADQLKKDYLKFQFHSLVMEYCHQMWDCYSEADLVISRAGATTLAELIATQIPAILIPYPHAGKHQSNNAKILGNLGSAFILEEDEMVGDIMGNKLRDLIFSKEKLDQLRNAYEKFPVNLKQSAGKLAEIVEGISR